MGLTGALGRAVLILTTDGTELEKGLEKASKEVKGELKKLGVELAGAFAVGSVVALGKQVIDFAGHLTDLSAQTGISTTGLQKLDLAFMQSGISLDTVTAATTKLAKNLLSGDKSTIGALQKLGLSLDQLKKMSPEDQFIKVADAIGGIQNPTEKAYAAMAVFGKGGAELLAGLDGHLAETTKHFEDMGLIIDEETVKAADDFGDQLGLMGRQLLAITATLLGPLLPALSFLGNVLMWLGKNVIGPVLNFVIKGLIELLVLLYEQLALFLARIADLATKIPVVGKQLGFMSTAADYLRKSAGDATAYLAKLTTQTDTVGTTAKKATPALIGLGELPDGPLKSLLKTMEDMVARLTPMPGHFITVSQQAKAFGEQCAKIVEEADAMGVKVPASIRQIAEAWNATQINELMAKTVAKWTEDLNKMNERGVAILDAMSKNFMEALLKNDSIIRDSKRETSVLTQQLSMSDYQFQVAQVERWADETKRQVDDVAGNHEEAFTAIEALAKAKLQLLARDHQQAIAEMVAEVGFWRDQWRTALAGVPDMLASAFTGGGGLGGAAKALVSKFGGMVGQQFVDARNFGIPIAQGVSKLFGNVVGDAFGMMLPGIGGLLGPAIAGLGSLIAGIGGPSKTELEGRDVAKQFEQLHGGWKGAQKDLMDAGLTADQTNAKLEALWAAEKQGGAAVQRVIDDINKSLEAHKQAVEELPKLVTQVASGMNAISAGTIGAFNRVHDKLQELLKDSDHFTADQKKQAADLQKQLDDIGATGQGEFDRIGRLAMTAFNAAIAGGQSFAQAIDAIGPTLDQLALAQGNFGFTADSTLQKLLQFRVVADQNKELIDTIDGVNQMMAALDKMGLLTQTDFDDLNAVASDTFSKMTAQGVDSDTALRAMQPTLQKIWEIQQATGLAVDDTTQGLLDQAEAQGIVGEAMKSVQQQTLDVLKAIAKALGADIPDSAQKAATGIETAFKGVKLPKIKVDFDIQNPDLLSRAVPEAEGGIGRVTKPTLFFSKGNEDFAFSGEGKSFARGEAKASESGDAAPVVIVVKPEENSFDGIVAVAVRAAKQAMPSAVKFNEHGLRSQILSAVRGTA